MSLAERPRLRLLTFCLLYAAQGIPWGFMATTLPAYLTKRGLDAGFVGAALAFTTLPYTFKWIWGPIIDTYTLPRFGRRRPWIIFAQGMMAVTLVALIAIPDLTIEVRMLAWMIFLHTVFNALQDVAVDALAVDLLTDEERGRANGLMYGSKYFGGIFGGAGMAYVIASSGLRTALLLQTAILVAIMFVPLLVKESNTPPPPRTPGRELARSLGQAFSLRSTLVAAVLMLGMNFAIGVISATGYALFVGALGWKPESYTAITGGWGLVVGGSAAMLTGFILDRFGRRPVAAVASRALAGGWIVFALGRGSWTDLTFVRTLAFYEAAATGVLSVSLIALCMDLSWTKIGGSQFAAYMALSNFSTTLGYQFSARAQELWDWHGIYLVAAVCQVVMTFVLLPIDPTQTKRELTDATKIN
ncbi:MAG: MFS transporter, partial [Deltaproteobacteria bacterium]|nr:MFS transporter [Deltaproteobacteria bacterium]